MSLTHVPVVGRFAYRDADATPAAGETIHFIPVSRAVLDGVVVTLPKKLIAKLNDDGEVPAGFTLPTVGDGVFYKVIYNFGGIPETTIEVLTSTPEVDLATYPVAIPSDEAMATYLRLQDLGITVAQQNAVAALAAIIFQNAGAAACVMGDVNAVNFTGSGVTATFADGTLTVTISAGSGGGGDFLPATVVAGGHQVASPTAFAELVVCDAGLDAPPAGTRRIGITSADGIVISRIDVSGGAERIVTLGDAYVVVAGEDVFSDITYNAMLTGRSLAVSWQQAGTVPVIKEALFDQDKTATSQTTVNGIAVANSTHEHRHDKSVWQRSFNNGLGLGSTFEKTTLRPTVTDDGDHVTFDVELVLPPLSGTLARTSDVAAAEAAAALDATNKANAAQAAAELTASNADNLVTGTVNDARIPMSIARDLEVTNAIAAEATARDTAIATAIAALINSAPGLLDTLDEIAAALGDDPNFSTTITTLIAAKQDAAANLAAWAGLASAANKLGYFTASGAAGLCDFTAYMRTVMAAADDAAARSLFGLGSAATQNSSAFEAAQTPASDGEADAGTETAVRSWSPAKIWRAIAAKLTSGTWISGATTKATPVDADTFPMSDSAGSGGLVKVSLAWFKTIFAPISHTQAPSTLTQAGATTGQVLAWDGMNWAPATAGGSPAGSGAELQYRNGGAFGAAAVTHWDSVNGRLSIGAGTSPAAKLHAQTAVASGIPIIAQGTTSQTGNLFEAWDVSGTSKATINPSGDVKVGSGSIGVAVNASAAAYRLEMAYGSGLRMVSSYKVQWSNSTTSLSTIDTAISRVDTKTLGLFDNGSGGAAFELLEMSSAPAAGATNSVRVYAEDNGSGKTRLMARFPTGAAQQLAIEP